MTYAAVPQPRIHGDQRLDLDLIERVCTAARATPGDLAAVVAAEVERLTPLAEPEDRQPLIDRALARLDGLDVIDDLLRDPEVDEVLINAGREVWVDRSGSLGFVERLEVGAIDAILERVLAPLGRRVDRTQPVVDARLANGARVCAVVAPVAVDGTAIAVRRHRTRQFPLGSFAEPPVAAVIADLVATRANIVVSGATSSGKTSLLAAILAVAPASDRLVVIEDTAELPVEVHNGVRLEARPATADAHSAVTMDDLVVAALRLRPDRLVIGEFRGTEVGAVVQALNTGHDGSLATCHANSAVDALRRIETLLLQASPGWPLGAIRRQISRSIDAVIHVARRNDGRRAVVTVAEVIESDGEPTVRVLTHHDQVLGRFERPRQLAVGR